uniref:K Homology domain-containing protein n=1 Tax=Lygus hesperus TaxID=30085 RepID=A0A0K8T1F7_LYGHE
MAADSGMDTCPSPENADSRKRPLDSDVEDATAKKSNCSSGNDGVYHFKILVPSGAAGAIIGKGGETIAQLQKETNARVKMSKANDFYPGTSERVCLISGGIDAIMEVLEFINFKIREKPDLANAKTSEHDGKSDREKQVKILVPNTTAGMIIGKGGSYIKLLKEESGAYVQISQKAKDQSLQERCITVMGDSDNNKKACAMILSKVQEDPQSGSSLNISYADIPGPVANFNPTGSPYAHTTTQQAYATAALTSSVPWAGLTESSGLTGITLTINLEPNAAPPQAVISQVVNGITVALENTGYPEHAKAEISTAISTLGKYRMLGVSLTGTSAHPATAFVGMTTIDGTPTANGVFGPIGGATARTVMDLAMEPFRHSASGPNSPPHLNNNSFSIKSATDDKKEPLRKVEMEISEAIVGAILGPGGRALIEIQQVSGALVQISKKGMYAPGTRNRVVTISGGHNAVTNAQYLIEQRVKEEELKRSRQSQLLMLQ